MFSTTRGDKPVVVIEVDLNGRPDVVRLIDAAARGELITPQKQPTWVVVAADAIYMILKTWFVAALQFGAHAATAS